MENQSGRESKAFLTLLFHEFSIWKFYFDITSRNLRLIIYYSIEFYSEFQGVIGHDLWGHDKWVFRVRWIPWHENFGRFPCEFPNKDLIRGLDEKFQNANTGSSDALIQCALLRFLQLSINIIHLFKSHMVAPESIYIGIYNARLWMTDSRKFSLKIISIHEKVS